MMVDLLEEQDPEIFKNKETTFIDLYAKSGLYLTEIAKRLFVGLEEAIPDEEERIRWILEQQLYGCAPSNIIYNMVRNYVYAGFPEIDDSNLLELDLTEAAKEGRVKQVLAERYGKDMKFDVIIGNPPYQEETFGTSDNPVYHLFMQEAYKLANKVCLITPARFLFNAGKTPRSWNFSMLNNPNLKVAFYEPDSKKVFPDALSITGGIAITFLDKAFNFGIIGTFSPIQTMNSILTKVRNSENFSNLSKLIYLQNKFNLNELLNDYPEYKTIIGSNGKEKRLTTNIFSQLNVFSETQQDLTDIKIYGLINNVRQFRFIPEKYLEPNQSTTTYKVVLPKSNGSPAVGESVNTPVIGEPIVLPPQTGYTQSFIGIGRFKTNVEAQAALKYTKSKFARMLLGTLKVTQDNNIDTWDNVPLQNFTPNSDIVWTKPISEIDQQLYNKYGLTDKEIDFIESMIQPME